MEKNARWTYMVYMAGDNNLSTAGDEDLKEMRQVGSSPNVNVLVQFDNAGNKGTRRYRIQRGGINEKVEELGEMDSGDPIVLEDFIAWSYDNYPAERYALILWNHGGGWEPSDLDRLAKYERTKKWNTREASYMAGSKLKKTFFSTTVCEILNSDSPNLRAICSDDDPVIL
jgi:Clostripain family.